MYTKQELEKIKQDGYRNKLYACIRTEIREASTTLEAMHNEPITTDGTWSARIGVAEKLLNRARQLYGEWLKSGGQPLDAATVQLEALAREEQLEEIAKYPYPATTPMPPNEQQAAAVLSAQDMPSRGMPR